MVCLCPVFQPKYNQFAKGLVNSNPDIGPLVKADLERVKWYLWHGNVEKALDIIDLCYMQCEGGDIQYEHRKKFKKYLSDVMTYIQNNQQIIPNYGEKYRYGKTISTAYMESIINEVVAKRMVKKQQVQWTHEGRTIFCR